MTRSTITIEFNDPDWRKALQPTRCVVDGAEREIIAWTVELEQEPILRPPSAAFPDMAEYRPGPFTRRVTLEVDSEGG